MKTTARDAVGAVRLLLADPAARGRGLVARGALGLGVPAIPLIRGGAMGPVVAFLHRTDAPIERYVDRAAIEPRSLAHPETLVPLSQVSRLVREAAVGEGMPALGLMAAQQARLEDMGTYGRAVRAARTLGEAIHSATSLSAAWCSGERWWIDADEDEARLYHAFVPALAPEHATSEHYYMALMVNVVRQAAGPTWRPREVHWQSDYSAAVVDHEMFRGAQLRFARAASRLTIPRPVLRLPMAYPRADAAGRLDVDAWRENAPPADLLGGLREVIAAVAPRGGHPRIERVAAALGVGVRTLQRRLSHSSLCFEDVAKEMRLEQAVGLLERTEARILDIALDLGYSDHAHFTRAFRGWMGLSPTEYRRRRRNGAANQVQQTG